MKKINVSIVIPSLETGGAESMASQLAEVINANKFNLHFICLYSRKETKFEKKIINAGINITYLGKGLGLNIITFLKLWRLLDKHNTQIVHTHLGACLYASPWSFFTNKKLIHTIHNMPSKELPLLHQKILRMMYKRKKAIPVAISDTILDKTSIFYNLNKQSIKVIYNPVNTQYFVPKVRKEQNQEIVFLCIARLTYQKNHKMLLKAFSVVNKQISNATLLLAGEGELKEELMREAERLKISKNVHFLGNVDNVVDLLNSSDVFILPSFYEGLPMTILEAMSAKLPVIATSVGGVPDIVKGNGLLVESDNYKSTADAMIQLAKDVELREMMGNKGFELSKNYDINVIAKKYEDLYQKYAQN